MIRNFKTPFCLVFEGLEVLAVSYIELANYLSFIGQIINYESLRFVTGRGGAALPAPCQPSCSPRVELSPLTMSPSPPEARINPPSLQGIGRLGNRSFRLIYL